MRIREAKEADKPVWDSFVDTEDGMFHQYFGWKHVYKIDGQVLIPLMIENDQSQLIGIVTLFIEKYKLYSLLRTFGFKSIIFRKDLPPVARYSNTREVIKFIDQNYSSGCSAFFINEQLPLDYKEAKNQGLIDSGFRVRRLNSEVPVSHILPLKAPFEQHIWKGLWSQKLRQALNKVEKNGVKVIQDPEFKYLEQFAGNVIINYKRHKSPPPSREFLLSAFKEFGRNMKLFVALKEDHPVALLACIYTPSTCYLWEIGTYVRETDDINKYCYKVAIEDACNSGYQYADFLGAYTVGLSNLKKRYGTRQTPIVIYEKRYSKTRVLIQYGPAMIKHLFFNPKYLWENRAWILDRIFHW